MTMKHTVEGDKVGATLRAVRKHRRMTQAKLAEVSGVPQCNISKMENGRITEITVQTFVRLMRAMNMSVEVAECPDDGAGNP